MDKKTVFNDSAIVRYVSLSSLARQKSRASRQRILEQCLRAHYGAEAVEPLKLQRDPTASRYRGGSRNIPSCVTAIQALSEKTQQLRASELDLIVIDQEAELPSSLLGSACQHLKTLLFSGIDVGIFFVDSGLVSLKEVSRLTTSDEFIRIYLKEIWKPHDMSAQGKRTNHHYETYAG